MNDEDVRLFIEYIDSLMLQLLSAVLMLFSIPLLILSKLDGLELLMPFSLSVGGVGLYAFWEQHFKIKKIKKKLNLNTCIRTT